MSTEQAIDINASIDLEDLFKVISEFINEYNFLLTDLLIYLTDTNKYRNLVYPSDIYRILKKYNTNIYYSYIDEGHYQTTTDSNGNETNRQNLLSDKSSVWISGENLMKFAEAESFQIIWGCISAFKKDGKIDIINLEVYPIV